MRTARWKHWIGVAGFAWTKQFPSRQRTSVYGRITLTFWKRGLEMTRQRTFFLAGWFALRKHLFARRCICDFGHMVKKGPTIYKLRFSKKSGSASAMFPAHGTCDSRQNHSS